jgi:cytochrome b involved in lipid metabolism
MHIFFLKLLSLQHLLPTTCVSGGREIIMEFAGKDADDMFEDIGHSSEARNMMKKYLKGDLKVDPTKQKKQVVSAVSENKSGILFMSK